jgi:Protein of unknown function (DUF1552)
MIIKKMALPRRTLLKGLGATVALPLLDAMVPALSMKGRAAGKPAVRLGFIYAPNGQTMTDAKNYWTPTGAGKDFEWSPILTPLAPYRDRVTVVSGLAHPQAEALGDGNGEHTRAGATWLNGVHPRKTEGAGIGAGISADQIAAAQFGKATVVPSLELMVSEIDLVLGGQCEAGYSCAYLNTISWQSSTTPLPVENNPSVIFDRLFGDGSTREERLARMQANRSLLDRVLGDLGRLQRTLGPSDRTRVDQYLESVREIERRIHATEQQGADPSLSLPDRPAGVPVRFDDHVKLMFDLQWLAYQVDLTRVFTLMLGRELNQRSYPEIGISEPHHGLSHHGNKPEMMEKYAKLNTFQAELFAYFLGKLRSTPEGDGNLLDNSILVYGSGFSNGDVHWHRDLPIVVAGGGAGSLRGGRHLAYPAADMIPMTNLLVSLLDKAGVRMDGGIGDSTGKIDLETLSGV